MRIEPGYYRLEVGGVPIEWVMVREYPNGTSAVWGLSFYDGTWAYRTLGIDPNAWLERYPKALLVPDQERFALPQSAGQNKTVTRDEALRNAIDDYRLARKALAEAEAAEEEDFWSTFNFQKNGQELLDAFDGMLDLEVQTSRKYGVEQWSQSVADAYDNMDAAAFALEMELRADTKETT
jgi:hypothetical protein